MNIQILKFHYFHWLFIIENAVNCFTGTWLPVTRGVKIPYNLTRTPLQIRTNSADGSGDKVYVEFYQSTPQHILQDAPPDRRESMSHIALGFVRLSFKSPPQYQIGFCTQFYSPFLSALPSDVNKTWKIVMVSGPSPRITVHCNEVEVVDIIMSDETCYFAISIWRMKWREEVEQIEFLSFDTASDFYIPAPGKYIEYTLYIKLVTTRNTSD